ncbi:hypothetical protein EVG20_g6100 [Dentipellis fragilis]|uniref:Uncharacterized protein n=1 Tax=Dentipellis fragilis TaxID=205917 RepID=A0A4Y9YN26_9AGAM|nr:hypothetical protein EVG20_g6100 [Dentipellis fragilis]
MIAGLSKAITLYLAPLLALTSIFLTLFAFLAPVVMLHSQVSLLSVTPSTALTDPGSSGNVDGPTVFMGALGSCSRRNPSDDFNCTMATLSPVSTVRPFPSFPRTSLTDTHIDLSALPPNTPDLLTAPTQTTPAFIAVSLGFAIIFFFLFTAISLRAKLGPRLGAAFERPAIQRLSAWIGLLGFMIGLTAFLVLRMWFGKAVEDFNRAIQEAGKSAPQLVASTNNGFTMVWVGYAFQAVPLICALARLHVTSGGK